MRVRNKKRFGRLIPGYTAYTRKFLTDSLQQNNRPDNVKGSLYLTDIIEHRISGKTCTWAYCSAMKATRLWESTATPDLLAAEEVMRLRDV